MTTSSRLPGFYNKSLADRLQTISEQAGLTSEDLAAFSSGLSLDGADHMIENVVGLYNLPFGIATNFRVNNKEVLVPMVIEEPSVVAGASLAARLARHVRQWIKAIFRFEGNFVNRLVARACYFFMEMSEDIQIPV